MGWFMRCLIDEVVDEVVDGWFMRCLIDEVVDEVFD